MERLKHVVKRAGPVVSFAFFTTYDLVMDSEDEAIWYGASLKKLVTLPR
jgi:hypothetical protein